MSYKKISVLILVTVLLGVGLAGCQLSASTPEPTSSSPIVMPPTMPPASTQVTKPAVAITTQPTVGGTPQPTQPAPTQPATPLPDQSKPTTKPQIVVPTVTPGRPATYTVQQGDHYVCIARRFNLNLDEFFALNGLSMSSQAVAGVKVNIPAGGSWSTAHGPRMLKSHPTTYVVAAEDTVNRIACLFGDVDPNQIILANNLKAPYTLTPGQTINLP
jgi:LysM repeat protein